MTYRILVIGGGVGGMSFAIHARNLLGAEIDLVEIDPNWRVYGAGITITAPTYRALKQLGVLDEIAARGFFVTTGGRMCSLGGDPIADLPMPPLEPGLPSGGGIARPDLHAILSRRVREQGVTVKLGISVEKMDFREGGVGICFSDGAQAVYDIVVAADGAFSPTRKLLFPNAPAPQYTGQYCWRVNAARPAEIDRPHFFIGNGGNAGLIPVSDDEMYMWLLEDTPVKARIPDAELPERLAKLMAPFGGPLRTIRESLTPQSEINARPLDSILVPAPWYRGRVILIGDAVHATTPHLASGAGAAVEDGIVLAETLRDQPNPHAAFAAFMERRFERCRRIVDSSVRIGAMQQAKASPQEIAGVIHEAQTALRAEI